MLVVALPSSPRASRGFVVGALGSSWDAPEPDLSLGLPGSPLPREEFAFCFGTPSDLKLEENPSVQHLRGQHPAGLMPGSAPET